jgi:hypothetical protein
MGWTSLYDAIRRWSAPDHQAMWMEVQSVTMMLGLAAAGWYASIAHRHWTAIERQLGASERQLRTAETQLRIAEGQLLATRRELQESWLSRWQDNKPIVFTDYRECADSRDGRYVICNIGRGFAVNVFLLCAPFDGWRSLGGLGAGETREIPGDLQADWVANPDGNCAHILLAEGVPSRTRRWNPSFNCRTSGMTIVHSLYYPDSEPDPERIRREAVSGIEQYAEENQTMLVRELGKFAGSHASRSHLAHARRL